MANETNQPGQIVTIERHILEEQSSFPAATGTLTALLYDIALAGKIIASKTNRAGLAEILGRTGATNIQGEQVQKLDQFADAIFFNMNDHTGRVSVMASEEHEHILPIPEKYPAGKYVLLFDPLMDLPTLITTFVWGRSSASITKFPKGAAAWRIACKRADRWWRPVICCTAPAPCWSTAPGAA